MNMNKITESFMENIYIPLHPGMEPLLMSLLTSVLFLLWQVRVSAVLSSGPNSTEDLTDIAQIHQQMMAKGNIWGKIGTVSSQLPEKHEVALLAIGKEEMGLVR